MKSKPVRQIPGWIRQGIETILVTEHNCSMTTLAEALSVAVQHHQAGRLSAAEEIYRQILAIDPQHADAWHLLGLVAHHTARPQLGVEYVTTAIHLHDSAPDYYYNLGQIYRTLKNYPAAIKCLQRVLELKPNDIEAYCDLGTIFEDQGMLESAESCCRRIVELNPNSPDAHYNLGTVLMEQGKLAEASNFLKLAIELQPIFAEAYYNLGNVFKYQTHIESAVSCFERAVELNPDFGMAYNNLGTVLKDQGKLDAAIACYQKTIQLQPDDFGAYYNLGIAFHAQGDLDAAITSYQQAIALKPDFAMAYDGLGTTYKDQGKLDAAIASYQKAIELNPKYAEAYSNLLLAMTYAPGYEDAQIIAAHQSWNRHIIEPLLIDMMHHSNVRDPSRRIRIGYVSPDFSYHPVGRFMLPLLEEHDHEQFAIYAYSSVRLPNDMTDRCRAAVDVWRDVRDLSDEQLAELVRQDEIDILVDLSMHTAQNRLLMFARKPAPVQVTYLAYCGTTGLPTIDYRFTDPYRDPAGKDAGYSSEKTICLPDTLVCYRPLVQVPTDISPRNLTDQPITFGCLNNLCKVTPEVLATWCRIMKVHPGSQLLLYAPAGRVRQLVQDFFAEQELERERLQFINHLPLVEYFACYDRIDIALDPFPYAGGTTTFDTLWMGVPVVTLAGKTEVGRGGVSALSNLGLTELVARDKDEYVRIAAELANDFPRLAELRATLRPRMLSSPLMDAPRFARNIEAAYRQMWRAYCQI